ncbi:MAG: AbrB family transcriptional regulator [Bacillota bacterium]|nr:AbrB family transcriptional regulator [Bacillota bacterium]MDD3297625.1 AbrB family transcriptional regulator [Bacillota bacterium]MDD3850866.1 AbrB family transcriptional regulator [Bacillota bacterium]MDD4707476.1 AbrB family transcriptional regulator [Bacillota bacterium]
MENHIFRVIITLGIGCAGAYAALRFKVTAGAMLGSLFAVSLYGGVTSAAFMPEESRIISQIVAGAFIGTGMSKEKVVGLKEMIWPAAFMLGGLLLINLIMGSVIHYATASDLTSTLLATTPGGISTMTIIAYEMGADTSVVLVFQFARLVAAISLLPLLIRRCSNYLNNDLPADDMSATAQDASAYSQETIASQSESQYSINIVLITVTLAMIGGIIGNISGLPAAVLVMSMLFTTVLKIKTNIGFVPIKLKRSAQVLSGAFIGCNVSTEILKYIIKNLLPILIMMIAYVFLCAVLGFLLHKIYGLDLTTAVFCCTPAGMSDMVLISSEFGAESSQVAILQLIRTIGVLSFFPVIINLVV